MIEKREDEILSQIKTLEKAATEILDLKNTYRQRRPIFIEFCGSPKSGKTSCINSLNIFLKRNGFKTHILTERASICPIPDKQSPYFNIWTSCAIISSITENVYYGNSDVDVIIADRGIFDSLCWFQWFKHKKYIDNSDYNTIIDFLTLKKWVSYIDLVYVFTAKPEVSIQREYANLLTRKPGSIMNEKTLKEYLKAINTTIDTYGGLFRKVEKIDTSEYSQNDVSASVTSSTLSILKDLLIERIGFVERDILSKAKFGANDYASIESDLNTKLRFDHRDVIEESDHVQPIPVAVITNETRDKVLLLKKNDKNIDAKSPEKGKSLLYVGGHIREEDSTTLGSSLFIDVAKTTLIREIKEEIGISLSLDESQPFFIYTPIGKSAKHVAICFVIQLDINNLKLKLDAYELTQRTGKTKSGTFVDVSEIIDPIEYEEWSIEILNKVFSKNFPQQQSMVI